MSPIRLGVFGGTFDPPHLGHLVVAQDAVERLSLDRLVFLVAGLPPHKLQRVITPSPLRLEMVQAAVAGDPVFEVSDVELQREGPTFTVDTLRHFRAANPDADLYFLLGLDQLAEFHEWREPERIADLATLVAVGRNGVEREVGEPVILDSGRAVPCLFPEIRRIDISSTEIRGRVEERRSIRYLVPPDVRRIIENHRLYRPFS